MTKGYQSPVENRSPGQRSVYNTVHEDLNLKEKNKDLGTRGVLLAKPKQGAREASPGLVEMQEEEPSSVFQRNMNKRRSTKNASNQMNISRVTDASKSSLGEASPGAVRGGIQTRNQRSNVPESADFGKTGNRMTGSSNQRLEYDYRYANSPNNPDNEDPVTNLDDEEDNFAPSQNTLNRSKYNKNQDQGKPGPKKNKSFGID